MNERVKDIAIRIKGLRLLAGVTEQEVADVINTSFFRKTS
jgi:hypothetical protein